MGAIEVVKPCRGVCRDHLLGDESVSTEAFAAFGSVVRQAMRVLDRNPGILKPHDRWNHAGIRGVLASPNGGVSGVMGTVNGADVFWSKGCTGFAGPRDGKKGVPRCAHCKEFYRRGVAPRATRAARSTPPKNMRNCNASTDQKVGGFRSWRVWLVFVWQIYCSCSNGLFFQFEVRTVCPHLEKP